MNDLCRVFQLKVILNLAWKCLTSVGGMSPKHLSVLEDRDHISSCFLRKITQLKKNLVECGLCGIEKATISVT